MQIHLKQPAIEEALKDYIVKKGINLQGCDVVISFVSARKPSGLTADIEIIECKRSHTKVEPIVSPKEVTEESQAREVSSNPLVWAHTAEVSQKPTNEEEKKVITEAVDETPSSLFG